MEVVSRSEDRALTVRMSVVVLGALLVVAALGIAALSYIDRRLADTYAGIVGAVAREYPLAETAAVRNLRSPDPEAVALGNAVLQKYGLDEYDLRGDSGVAAFTAIVPAGVGFAVLVCVGFIVIIAAYRRSIAAHIAGISDYLRRIGDGEYSLDLRDNEEGRFSLLKNDVYKITVRLREQAGALQRDKTALTNLVTDISHQIKTPLTSIGLMTDLLSEDPPEADRRAFVEKLRTQIGRIQWLVIALLKMARLDAGTAAFKRERVELHALIALALEPLRIPLDIKSQRVDIRGDTGAGFTGDLQWSAEALTNVIKNCVEHSPADAGIEIACSENPLYTEIVVSDRGEGIPAKDLPHIFDRFYRGANATENSVGIGLALARAVLQAQGGDIGVQSQPGTGTVFTIRMFSGVA